MKIVINYNLMKIVRISSKNRTDQYLKINYNSNYIITRRSYFCLADYNSILNLFSKSYRCFF